MPDAGDLQVLKAVALLGGCRGPVRLSTQSLGTTIGTSPQTISRRLKALESAHLITRTADPAGQSVTITKAGEELLRREHADYCRIFSRTGSHYILQGTIISGLGEGRYYMSLDHYRDQIRTHFGFEPFPGTLNLRLNQQSVAIRKKLEALEWTIIPGFSDDHRTFGEARCLPCRIQGVPCALIVPGRTHYPEDIIEVIAGVPLREELGFEDNDTINVEIGL
ncbi:MAG: DUF120 domain-containing protein [Methanocalculus sp. MSAO_Arc1]|uniref:DUF120 domain-containing protein n=1 Tax=Methanocalculus TaxID=71151 RepID=UPI000FF27744|nr:MULTISPECIES: DUF120 domain-containing protein [unclassified Methanocalculus]RQD82046.1 MAG: DUF120 domain-containing protein [Methanocalculus sp. MSAO_Arc1]